MDEQVRRGREFARQQAGKPYMWGESSMSPEEIQRWIDFVSDEEAVDAWCERHGVTIEPMPSTDEILAEMTRQSGSPIRAIPWEPPPRWRPSGDI